MNSKNVLVLPGSHWQVELIKKIREMGYQAYVVNPYDNSPCFEYANSYLKADIFDETAVLSYCHQNNIEAIISDECDIATPLVARLGKELSLSTIDTESARLYTDKFMMREFCRSHGLKYPEYRLCKNVDDAIELFYELKKPLIIKPLDCNASKGVFKVENEEQIRKYFDEALSFSRSRKYVLAERYINGTEFTIDGIKTPSMHYTLAISEKKHFEHNVNIASELFFSHYNYDYNYNELKRINDIFIMNSSLEYGFTHAEYKYENGDFYLIEIAARGGGNMISSIITQFMSGHDTYKYLIECSLGNIYEKDFTISQEYMDRVSILKFFKTPEGGGKVKSILGLDILDNEKDIVRYMLNFKVGDIIEDAKSDSARIGFYIVCSENIEKLNEVLDKIDNTFKIIMEE